MLRRATSACSNAVRLCAISDVLSRSVLDDSSLSVLLSQLLFHRTLKPAMAANSGPHIYKRWDDGFVVRKMTQEDTQVVQKWFAAICPTSCDLAVALSAYPPDTTGFYVGELDGELVASVIRIPMCEGIYYGSYYYVDDRFRGKGFGRRIRDDIADVNVGKNIVCIDAHDNLEEMNRRHGYHTAFKVVLHSGTYRATGETRSDANLVNVSASVYLVVCGICEGVLPLCVYICQYVCLSICVLCVSLSAFASA